MAAVAENDPLEQILPAREPDSAITSRNGLILGHKAPEMTLGCGLWRYQHGAVDTRETMSEDNHLLVGSRSNPPPEAVSRCSVRRWSSRHRSLSRSRSFTEPPPIDTVSATRCYQAARATLAPWRRRIHWWLPWLS